MHWFSRYLWDLIVRGRKGHVIGYGHACCSWESAIEDDGLCAGIVCGIERLRP